MSFPVDWSSRQTSAPSCQLVETHRAKLHLRISGDTFDVAIEEAIEAATQQVEHDTDRALRTAGFTMDLLSVPTGRTPIPLKQKPIQSVEAVRYWNGVQYADMPPTDYVLDSARRWVFPLTDWPGTVDNAPGAVIAVDYLAGYGDNREDVPALFTQAILLQTGRWFNDPMMERSESYTTDAAYNNLIARVLRTSYP